MLKSVLIANRGEIALRIVRACRELGIESVAVYSEADRRSPHVRLADRAVAIGPAPAPQSYLRGDRLIEAALGAGADAIHPGYGFLAERAVFAEAVVNAGLVFVGPDPATITAMGDKTEARRRMAAAGVPIVPGTVEPITDPTQAGVLAAEVGYPVLLKASAGGGGKGMRVVREPDELLRALEAASREALGAFGDGAVYLERFLDRPRHLEIQVLGDRSGRVVHLGERECSIQRRHQKLVEESPSAILDAETRARMGQAAVQAAEAVDYVGAGTVEFLYEGGAFFFLEMNTRIQVEHPVTELVTGIDLVEWQLRVAGGEPLPFGQEDVRLRGHAIECRITSEDVRAGFLPSTGTIRSLTIPAGPGVRWDGGVDAGSEVGLHYDPLLAKLIVHADSRERAIARMSRALSEFACEGVETCVPLLRRILAEPDFRAGALTIRYLEEHETLFEPEGDARSLRDAAIAAALLEETRRRTDRARIAAPAQAGLPVWRLAGLPGGGKP